MRNAKLGCGALLTALLVAGTSPAQAEPRASVAAFDRAFTRFKAGDLRVARVELLNALKEDPNNGVARLLFARVQLARGNGVAAETEIERAVKAGIPREKTLHLTAHALLLQGKASQALQKAGDRSIPPQFASYAARMRGRAQTALGSKADAGREFNEAVRVAPNNPDAYVDFARFQLGSADLPGAVRSIDRAIALSPNDVEALLLKGGVIRATQGPDKSLAWFDRALAVDANSIETLLERASTLSDLKRYDAARADLKRVTDLIPNHPLAMYLSAATSVREGKFDDATRQLAATKGMLDKYPPAQALRAQIALKQRNLGQASENLAALVAASPNNLGARRALAQVQLERGDARGALATLQPVADKADLDPGTLAMLGSAHAQVGEFAVAQGFYERAQKLAPNVGILNTQLAMTRMAQGDAKGATAGLEAVLQKDPKSLQGLTSLTYVHLRARDYKGALATSERIVAAYPNLPVAYTLRGTALLGVNDAKRAEADFRTAIAKDPKFLDARRNLAQLLVLTKRAPEGQKELRAIVASNPNDVRSLMLLADLAGASSTERTELLKRAVLVNPKDAAPRAALIQTYLQQRQPGPALTEAASLARDVPNNPSVLQLLAATQIANKQQPAAVETVRRIVAIAPKAAEAKLLLARAQAAAGVSGVPAARATLEDAIRQGGPGVEGLYIELIKLQMATKDVNGALATAERLKAQTPQKVAADKLIGDINLAAGRAPAALEAYGRVRAKVDNAQAAVLVANALSATGRKDQALKTLTDYRAKHPKDLMGGVAVADAYIALKDWRSAIAAYLSMSGTPAANSAAVLNNLAFAYNAVGDPRAVAAAAKANQLSPGQPTIEDTYGWVLVKTGRDPKRGLALLQSAAKGLPNDPNVRHHLGMAYKANGMRAEAQRELRAALAAKAGLDDPVGARAALAGVGG